MANYNEELQPLHALGEGFSDTFKAFGHRYPPRREIFNIFMLPVLGLLMLPLGIFYALLTPFTFFNYLLFRTPNSKDYMVRTFISAAANFVSGLVNIITTPFIFFKIIFRSIATLIKPEISWKVRSRVEIARMLQKNNAYTKPIIRFINRKLITLSSDVGHAIAQFDNLNANAAVMQRDLENIFNHRDPLVLCAAFQEMYKDRYTVGEVVATQHYEEILAHPAPQQYAKALHLLYDQNQDSYLRFGGRRPRVLKHNGPLAPRPYVPVIPVTPAITPETKALILAAVKNHSSFTKLAQTIRAVHQHRDLHLQPYMIQALTQITELPASRDEVRNDDRIENMGNIIRNMHSATELRQHSEACVRQLLHAVEANAQTQPHLFEEIFSVLAIINDSILTPATFTKVLEHSHTYFSQAVVREQFTNTPPHLFTPELIIELSNICENNVLNDQAKIHQLRHHILELRFQRQAQQAQQQPAESLNKEQSVHTVSVTNSIKTSVQKLWQRYGEQLATPSQIEAQLAAIEMYVTGLSTFEDNHPVPDHKLAAAERSLPRILRGMLSSFSPFDEKEIAQGLKSVSMREVIALVWLAIHDATPGVLTANKEDILRSLIQQLYEIQRQYNLEEPNNREQSAAPNPVDIPSCTGGTYNKLVETLNTLHKDVNISMQTVEIAALKFVPFCIDSALQYLNKLTPAEATPLLTAMFATKEGDFEPIWDKIKEGVENNFQEEFSTLFETKTNKKFVDIVSAAEYIPCAQPHHLQKFIELSLRLIIQQHTQPYFEPSAIRETNKKIREEGYTYLWNKVNKPVIAQLLKIFGVHFTELNYDKLREIIVDKVLKPGSTLLLPLNQKRSYVALLSAEEQLCINQKQREIKQLLAEKHRLFAPGTVESAKGKEEASQPTPM